MGNTIDLIAIIVTLIGIIVGLIQLFRSNSRDGVGSFVSFRLEAHRRCSIIMTRTVQICAFIILIIYISTSVAQYLPFIVEWPYVRILCAFESVLIWITLLSNMVLNQVLSFKDFKIIDKWIEKDEIKNVLDASLQICIFACVVFYFIVTVFNLALFGKTGTLITVFTFVLCAFSAFVSFLRTYFRLRTLYVVSDTKVVLKGLNHEYEEVHNYRYSKGNFIFTCDDKGILKKIQTNDSNVLLIEQVIDLDTNLKDIKLSAEIRKNELSVNGVT